MTCPIGGHVNDSNAVILVCQHRLPPLSGWYRSLLNPTVESKERYSILYQFFCIFSRGLAIKIEKNINIFLEIGGWTWILGVIRVYTL